MILHDIPTLSHMCKFLMVLVQVLLDVGDCNILLTAFAPNLPWTSPGRP